MSCRPVSYITLYERIEYKELATTVYLTVNPEIRRNLQIAKILPFRPREELRLNGEEEKEGRTKQYCWKWGKEAKIRQFSRYEHGSPSCKDFSCRAGRLSSGTIPPLKKSPANS